MSRADEYRAKLRALDEWDAYLLEETPLEQRAAAAALCEPRLLHRPEHARAVLEILDTVTCSLGRAGNRRDDAFLALRKGLGYCWSVAVSALPGEGTVCMEKWLVDPDKDIRWIMKENLGKARLTRMDAGWATRWRTRIGG